MASENLVNDLFEIVQINSKEKLSYNDFEKDLLKSINLQGDEIDRALSIMLSQAQVNPNIIGETKGGTFIVSPSYSAAVVSTIKYENKFIEGKQEFINNNNKLNEKIDFSAGMIIMADSVIGKMIESYKELSYGERENLWMSYSNMDNETKNALRRAHKDMMMNLRDDPNLTPTEKSQLDKAIISSNLSPEITPTVVNDKGQVVVDPDTRKRILEDLDVIRKTNPESYDEICSKYGPLDQLTDEQILDIKDLLDIVRGLYQSAVMENITRCLRDRTHQPSSSQNKEQNQYDEWMFSVPNNGKKFTVTGKDGTPHELVVNDMMQLGANLVDLDVNRDYLNTQEKKVSIVAKLDTVISRLTIDISKKEKLLETLINVIKSLTKEEIKASMGDVESLILGKVDLIGDVTIKDALSDVFNKHPDLLGAIRQDNIIVGEMLESYRMAQKDGVEIEEYLNKTYPNVDKATIGETLKEYEKYFNVSHIYVKEISSPQLTQSFMDNTMPESYSPAKKTIARGDKRPISEEEYEAGGLPKEEIIVDEDAIRNNFQSLDGYNLSSTSDTRMFEVTGLESFFGDEMLASFSEMMPRMSDDVEQDKEFVTPEFREDDVILAEKKKIKDKDAKEFDISIEKEDKKMIKPTIELVHEIRITQIAEQSDLIREAMRLQDERKNGNKDSTVIGDKENDGEELGE